MNTTWTMALLLAAAQQPTPKPAVPQDAVAPQGSVASSPASIPSNAGTPNAATPNAATPNSGAANTNSDAAEPVEQAPWPGTLAEGFDELRSLAQKQQYESARNLADALLAPNSFLRWKQDQSARGGWRQSTVRFVEPFLDWCGFDGLDERVRSEVYYARGVVGALAKDREAAENDFQRARGASVDRGLSDAALYDVGWLALDAGEEARATIPEISGKPPAPPMPSPSAGPSSPSGAPTKPPDPLQVARAAYLKAREHFVERLRSDHTDADTRANVELCLKRLRELDEIEKKREEEKQKQEQQKKDDQKQDSKDEKDKDKDKSKDEQKPEDSKDPANDPKDSDPNKKPEDEKKPEPPKDPKDDETKDDKAKPPRPTEAKEGEMSKEQMTQLLDRLQQLEDEARKIQAALKAARRANVKKDW